MEEIFAISKTEKELPKNMNKTHKNQWRIKIAL